MEILLAIIRIIEEEQDIHSETKFLDWQQKTESNAEGADKEKAKKKHEDSAKSLLTAKKKTSIN